MRRRGYDDAPADAERAGAEQSLARAPTEGWTVASMKDDWRTVFPL